MYNLCLGVFKEKFVIFVMEFYCNFYRLIEIKYLYVGFSIVILEIILGDV